MFLKRIAYALTGLVASALIAMGAAIPNLPSTSQYSEPSQIVGTINALIAQLNGNAGYATATPVVGVGSFCSISGTGTQVCNGQRGQVAYTSGITIAATGTVQTFTITNSAVAANSSCSATWSTAFTAGSAVTVATIVPTAGSLSVLAGNFGTTTNAVTAGTLSFNCFN